MNPDLLSRLWLHEPDQAVIEDAVRHGAPRATPSQLATEFSDLLLLNVYPHASVFLDEDAELNGPAAEHVRQCFLEHSFDPPELRTVAAVDHAGLCLAFLARRSPNDSSPALTSFLHDLYSWLPLCCFALEREERPFHAWLAAETRTYVLGLAPKSEPDLTAVPSMQALPIDTDEVTINDVVRFFLTPARSGLFLSRARLGFLALDLGLRLPFASRFDVMHALWSTAGDADLVLPLLNRLDRERLDWQSAVESWTRQFPYWRPWANAWLIRLNACRSRLQDMRAMASSPSTA